MRLSPAAAPAWTRSIDRHRRRRGQSLVEFAIVLPILLLLTLVALDFGRVYLGWINLQSMSRIAANLAANNPTAWQGGGDANVQAKYQNQIRNDAAATNCKLPLSGGVQTAPAPVFADTGGNGASDDIGDSATVDLSCTFNLITPGIKNIVGGSITVSASSVFPVKSGMTSTMGGGPVGTAPNAAFTGNGTLAPSTLSGAAPFTVTFRDTSGWKPDELAVDVPGRRDDVYPAGPAQPHVHPPGHLHRDDGRDELPGLEHRRRWASPWSLRRRSTSTTRCRARTRHRSRHSPTTRRQARRPTPGPSVPGKATSTQQNPTHTYSTAGTYSVTLTVTYPTGPVSVTKSVTLGSALCTVPSFNGIRRNNAQALWTSSGFTGNVSDGPNAPNGNFIILSQGITANSQVPCNSNITVNNP
jgi:Flp pilus assembly protein TadG